MPKFYDDQVYLDCWEEWGNRNGSLIPGADIAGGPGGVSVLHHYDFCVCIIFTFVVCF
jgi:hypothetical protein